MSRQAKIFVSLVITPILAALLNGYFADRNLVWSKDNLNTVSFWALLLGILGCLIVIYNNHKSLNRISFWYSIPIVTAFVLVIFLYFGYSLSNFGF